MTTKVEFIKSAYYVGAKQLLDPPIRQALYCCDVCLRWLEEHWGNSDQYGADLATICRIEVEVNGAFASCDDPCARLCGACEELPQNRSSDQNLRSIEAPDVPPTWWVLQRNGYVPDGERSACLVMAGDEKKARKSACLLWPHQTYLWGSEAGSKAAKADMQDGEGQVWSTDEETNY